MGGVQAVCGMHENLTHGRSIETEDTAVAVLRFRNGALGTVQVTTSSFLSWEHTFSYSGTEGCLDIRDGVPLRAAFRDSTTGEDVMASLGACRNVPALAAGKAYYGGGHTGQIADFVAAIQESRDPFIAAMDFRHTVDVVLGIYRSVRERRWVEIGVQDEC
jgi:UDP-N-acetyl-2-amino-2-deoxyglucuronate dehydrogenase